MKVTNIFEKYNIITYMSFFKDFFIFTSIFLKFNFFVSPDRLLYFFIPIYQEQQRPIGLVYVGKSSICLYRVL